MLTSSEARGISSVWRSTSVMEDWRGREQTWLASVSKDDHFMATSFRGTVLPLETLDCEPTLLGNQMRSVEKRRSAVIANKDRLVQCSVFKGLGSEDQALTRSTLQSMDTINTAAAVAAAASKQARDQFSCLTAPATFDCAQRVEWRRAVRGSLPSGR